MTATSNQTSTATTGDVVKIDVGEYDTIPFEFSFRSDGTGACRDLDAGCEEVSFSWDPWIVEGLDDDAKGEALSNFARELFWDEINDQLEEDRVLTSEDFGSEEVIFASGSSDDLERILRLILYSFPHIWTDERDSIDIEILASSESDSADIGEYCEFMEDGEIEDEDKERIRALIGYALDRNEPTGYHLEYNDGLSGRASGYYESQNSLSYTIQRPSFHDLAVARDQLTLTLGEELVAEVDRLLTTEVAENG